MNKWVIGKYIRLSQADRDLNHSAKQESDSITHQRALIQGFVDDDPELADCEQYEFFDDGYSGTGFDRPSFVKMIDMINNHEINCVIVKDFSRFGRDYIELGDYLERVFPLLGVRFISVNDGYDSLKYKGTTGGLDVVLKNIVYSYYSKDLSVKVKSTKRMRTEKGFHVGGEAPYGYRKDPKRKDTLKVDKRAAKIVREIFDRYLAGEKMVVIARDLNRRGVDTPAEHFRKRHRGNHLYHNLSEKHCWNSKMICAILKREEYYGAFVGHKQEVHQVGGECRHVPKQERIIIEGKHEPIISKEEFMTAQNMRQKKTFQDITPCSYPLRGKVYCGSCGRRCTYTSVQKKQYRYFICKYSGAQVGREKCTNRWMPEDRMNEIVLDYIRALSRMTENAEEKICRKQLTVSQHSEDLRQEQKRLTQLREKKEKARMEIMEAYMLKEIDKETFQEKKDKLRQELERIEERMAAFQRKQEKERKKQEDVDELEQALKTIHRYDEEPELTAEMVEALIEKVIYYDPEHVEIKCRFRDEVVKALVGKG